MVQGKTVTAFDDEHLYRVNLSHNHGTNIVSVEVKRMLFTIPVINKSILHPKAVHKDSNIVVGKAKSVIQEVVDDVHDKVGSGEIRTDDSGEMIVSA